MAYSFFDLPEEIQNLEILHLAKASGGVILDRMSGMCAWVYVVQRAPGTFPSRIAVKVPRIPLEDPDERARRFLREIEIEHSTFRHKFVGWAYDYDFLPDTPVALYRLWDGDLSDWIQNPGFGLGGRLATLAYLCSGLQHCRLRGLNAHQDMKPQNVLMRKTGAYPEHGDAMVFPMLADFGLANLSNDLQQADGARPYMAPEQWLQKVALPESDVFSLGVICYEVLTRGFHPIGEKTSEWWPKPSEGNSKKWCRDDIWIKWAKENTPIKTDTFLVPGAESIVRACLHPDPARRPKLGDLETLLMEILRTEDQVLFEQADLQIVHAAEAVEGNKWHYRDQRLARVKQRFGVN